jgi:hypothetical protein
VRERESEESESERAREQGERDPTLQLAMWHAIADTRGLRHPFVRPNHLATPSTSALGQRFRDPKPIF